MAAPNIEICATYVLADIEGITAPKGGYARAVVTVDDTALPAG